MKNKLFYFLLVFFSLVLPVAFLRNPMTGIACFSTLLALFGAGRAFHTIVFPSKHFEFNSFGLGFILLAAVAWAMAFYGLNAIFFTAIYIGSICYAVYWLLNYFREDDKNSNINIMAVIIYMVILAFNFYPTLLIQGYQHDNSFSWVNTDATVYTSIANRVKLGIYPITVPGFGIEKLVYHFGGYALAGFVANIFNISASDSLFGIIRGVAVFSIILSIISIANTANGNALIKYRIAGALIGFFLIGSLTSILEYLPFSLWRTDHGMKHLRGFLIAHSSLWIFMALVPVISFINYKIVHKVKFGLLRMGLFAMLVLCTASLNFILAFISFGMLMFFIFFYKTGNEHNKLSRNRNVILLITPLILLLIGIAIYLRGSAKEINSSLFFLPVFDLSAWSNFLSIFFMLYIGLRIFGLNYLFSAKDIHLGYIQLIVLIGALSFMTILGFFVEPMAGRENDIKYGYVIIQGTFGIFSGLWLGERFGNVWVNKENLVRVDLKKIFYPVILLFSLLLLLAVAGYGNSALAKGLLLSFSRPMLIAAFVAGSLLLLTVWKKFIPVHRNILFAFFAVLIVLSVPGVLHEFNKYRSLKENEETVALNADELSLVGLVNRLNGKNKLVLLSLKDDDDPGFSSSYKFSSLINAPLLNEGSAYFDVKHNKKFEAMDRQLDSLYTSNDIKPLKHLADQYGIEFCLFNSNIVNPAVFNGSTEFRIMSNIADSIYVVEYLPNK